MIYLVNVTYYNKDTKEILDLLKIGYTDNWDKRKSQYLLHNPGIQEVYLLGGGTEEQESKLHYKFKDFRFKDYGNEWFYYKDEIVDYIKSVTLEELDELPYPFTSRIKSGLAKEIVSKVITVENILDKKSVVEKYVNKMVNKLGKSVMEESSIFEYLENDPKIDNKNIELYRKIKNRDGIVYSTDDITNLEVSNFIRDYESLTTIKDKLKLLCESGLSKDAEKIILSQISDSDEIKSYYLALPKEKLRALSYNSTKIKKELGIVTFSQELLKECIFREFHVGDKLLLSDIKSRLSTLYKSINYNKSPKAVDILEFFTVKEFKTTVLVDGKKKRSIGYLIISVK